MLSFPQNDAVVVVRVEGLADSRGPYEEARQLYTDLSRACPRQNGALTEASAPF